MKIWTLKYFLLLLLWGCTSNEALYDGLEPYKDYYSYNTRKLPPEKPYKRLTWSSLPRPLPEPSRKEAPLFIPEIELDLKNSNLREALEVLSQTMGYRLEAPRAKVGNYDPKAKVSIRQVAPIDVLLAEVSRQSRVDFQLDHGARELRVLVRPIAPELPSS